jgi:hypothetical protein
VTQPDALAPTLAVCKGVGIVHAVVGVTDIHLIGECRWILEKFALSPDRLAQ